MPNLFIKYQITHSNFKIFNNKKIVLAQEGKYL